MSKPVFDKYITLFGYSDDERVKLFLHDLYEQSDINRLQNKHEDFTSDDIKFNVATHHLQSKYFLRPDVPSGTGTESDVHSEWVEFFCNILSAMSRKTVDNNANLKIIRELGGIKTPGSSEQFMQVIVRLIMSSIHSSSRGELLNDTSVWSIADDYKYKNLESLQAFLVSIFSHLKLTKMINAGSENRTNDLKNFLSSTECVTANGLYTGNNYKKHFGYNYDKPFGESLYTLINLDSLYFEVNSLFNQQINNSFQYLTTLKKLYFGNEFSVNIGESLDNLINLECLRFGNDYNHLLTAKLPCLTLLELGGAFNKNLNN
jgi:hypothetical protein